MGLRNAKLLLHEKSPLVYYVYIKKESLSLQFFKNAHWFSKLTFYSGFSFFIFTSIHWLLSETLTERFPHYHIANYMFKTQYTYKRSKNKNRHKSNRLP